MISLAFRKMAPVIFLSATLAGCGNILGLPGGGEAPQIFDLTSSYAGDASAAMKPVMIMDTITISDTLKTNYIAVKPRAQEYSFIEGVLWSDQLPTLMENYMVRQFSGPFMVVAGSDLDLKSDYRLRLDVEEFAAIVTGDKVDSVEVSVTATILQNAPLKPLGRKRFSQTVSARDSASDIVRAMNDAMASVTREISNWSQQYAGN